MFSTIWSRNYFANSPGRGGSTTSSGRPGTPPWVDQGQPAHLYPRRNPFLFTIRVPEGYSVTKEWVWTS